MQGAVPGAPSARPQPSNRNTRGVERINGRINNRDYSCISQVLNAFLSVSKDFASLECILDGNRTRKNIVF